MKEFSLLLCLLLPVISEATPFRYENIKKKIAHDEILIEDSQEINYSEMVKLKIRSDSRIEYKSIEVLAKSENGAGLLMLTRKGFEEPYQRVEGSVDNFNRPGNYLPIKFEANGLSSRDELKLTAIDDSIKVKGAILNYRYRIPQTSFSAKCQAKIKNPIVLGGTFKKLTSKASEDGYPDQRKKILKRLRKEACADVKRKCERTKWEFPLTYCTKPKEI